MKYERLTLEDRTQIERMLENGKTQTEIANFRATMIDEVGYYLEQK